MREYSIFSNHYKLLRKQGLTVDEAVRDTVRYCIDNDVMKNYLLHNESEVIDMFGFEWNEKEEREALLEAGLPGYREYEAKVRWRLIPYIW